MIPGPMVMVIANQWREYWMVKDSDGVMLLVAIVTAVDVKGILLLYLWQICHLA